MLLKKDTTIIKFIKTNQVNLEVLEIKKQTKKGQTQEIEDDIQGQDPGISTLRAADTDQTIIEAEDRVLAHLAVPVPAVVSIDVNTKEEVIVEIVEEALIRMIEEDTREVEIKEGALETKGVCSQQLRKQKGL